MDPSHQREERLRARSNVNKDQDAEQDKKRQKSLTDDLVCPITLELPFDPVTAEDGRVYERSAIENHMEGKSIEEVKSPFTGSQMGPRLLPAIQHKNHIQTLIDTELITGDLANNRNGRVQQKKEMDDLIAKAESGDADAMTNLGWNYERGLKGFKEEPTLAYSWNKKAHNAGRIVSTARLAYALLEGKGVARNEKDGILLIGIAAAQGSDMASLKLGRALAHGSYGLSANKTEAIKWLQKSLSAECTVKHLNSFGKQNARALLERLTSESA